MRLVSATGDQLQHILDETFPLWGEGLSRHGYEQWNLAQQQTLWGHRHLTRLALVDGDTVVATAKRYDLTMTLNGRATRTVGIGAVFTPKALRGRGHATAIVHAMEDAARVEGIETALLFSEIGSAFYEKLGFVTVPVQTVDIAVARGDGAPAMLVRSGEDRDAEHLAAMHAARATDFAVALLPDAAQIIYSVTKKRLFVGLHPSRRRRIEYFVAEEGHQAVAYVLLYVSTESPGAQEIWSVEACGDRDPSGARIGAMLQVLIARNPAATPSVIRGWWPALLSPPQLTVTRRPHAGEVMMIRSLTPRTALGPLTSRDVLYFHGDAF
jgi:GNAT superfamily N-acetyltransferase